MKTNDSHPMAKQTSKDPDTVVAAVREGDEAAFTAVTSRYRRELQAYCYRMLGSLTDSEDMVQETYLRAWRRRESFQGRSTLRAWLYAIATNGCLDFLEARQHRVFVPAAEGEQVPSWLEPYPDRLLVSGAEQPDSIVASRQTMELAYLVAIQHLPPRQRAVLILCDVLDWSAREVGDLLELSIPSVNSALQRARATMRERGRRGPERQGPGRDPDERERSLLERYVETTERGDVQGLAALLRDDLRWSMPPQPLIYLGRDRVVASWLEGGFGSTSFGDFRCLITRANGVPAVACYVRKPGETEFRPLAIDVLQIEDGQIAEIITFPLEPFVQAFALPTVL